MIRQSAALLHRALRVDARLIRSHIFRISLLAFLVFFFLLYDAQSSFFTGAPGLEFFGLIHLCNLWFVTFAGVTFFSTAITEEREEQTLGLLKMAGMSALALLTGKWAPRVVGGVLLLSVQLPFTMLAITLGGVLWDQVIAAYCTLLAHLGFVGCIGLLSSVVSKRSTGACILTTMILAILFMLPPAMLAVAISPAGTRWLPNVASETLASVSGEFVRASAWTRLSEIQATNFNEPPLGFQAISNLGAGAGFFVLAWSLFEICTRNDSAASATAGWWSRMSRWGRRRSRRAWNSALLWKDFYFSAGGTRALILKLIAYALLLAVCVSYLMLLGGRTPSSAMFVRGVGETAMGLMLLMLTVEIAVIAARCLRFEIRQRTWASLCMLPRGISEIAYRKIASQGLSLLPVIAWFWVGALLAPKTIIDFLDEVLSDADAFLAIVYVLLQLMWLMHVIALLSITIDWAAWPVSIFCGGFAVLIWNVMFMTCLDEAFRGPTSEVLLFMICGFACAQVVFTHWLIGERLRTLAGR